MIESRLINELAQLCAVPAFYLDWAGKPVDVADENRVSALQAMGFDMSSEQSVQVAIAQRIEQQWARTIPAVAVVHQGQEFAINVCFEKNNAPATVEYFVQMESGETKKGSAASAELEVVESQTINQIEKIKVKLVLPAELPLGYHTLVVAAQQCSLIVAPQTCFEPQAMLDGKKIWGSGVQLYSVRSERNWGMGDYTDLKTLACELGKNGADVVGLNPVHALYQGNPQHCSPYSPSSRIFGNVLYINPEAVKEYPTCGKAKAIFEAEGFQQRLAQVRELDYVNYSETAALKFEVLEKLYECFSAEHLANNTDRAKAFNAFCEEQGESLTSFALFDALFEHFRKLDMMNWGWPCWPEAFQNPESGEVKVFAKENADRIQYFKYLQWIAEEQIAEAQKVAKESGMLVGVYRDLAVGVDRGGADVWSNRRLYCLEASTGAPPDELGPQGQNWGLPPFNPVVLQEQGYQPFIQLVRNNMRDCGALRIDHAMGLFRLWWCPNGKGAAEGAYVHYPLQDMLGIIKLESNRQQCLVFGEDLGTVPQEITNSLPPARFYSSEMGIFEQNGDSFTLPGEYRQKALATLVCHDTPTLAGWWIGKDIDIRESLDIFDADRAASERHARQDSRQAVINTLRMIDEWPSDTGDSTPEQFTRQLMERFSYYLAFSNSQITGIQLEDCMLIDTPVNVPGTSTEYPNWQRRLTENLEAFFASEENKAFFQNLTGCRKA